MPTVGQVYFTKPSIAKREAMQHAIYVEHMYRDDE